LLWSAANPLAVLSLAVLLRSARDPVAVLWSPVELKSSAFSPTAMLATPVVLLESVVSPIAMLTAPVVLLKSVASPIAILPKPVALFESVLSPIAGLRPRPLIVKLPALLPRKVLRKPKLCRNGIPSLTTFPMVLSVELLIVRLLGTSTSWAAAKFERIRIDIVPTSARESRLCIGPLLRSSVALCSYQG